MLIMKGLRSCISLCAAAVALVILLAGIAVADDQSVNAPEQPDRITGEYLKGYLTDTGKILKSPVNWDENDWLKAGLVVGLTTGIYVTDSGIRSFAQTNQSSTGNVFATAGKALGDPFFTLPSLGLFYSYGYINDDPKARRSSLLAVESLTISILFTESIKLVAGRSRPNSGESSTTWIGPGLKDSNHSFPSGHTTAAFSVATVIAEEYGSKPYVAPIAYGLATLTGLSRLYDNEHWASDVFFGGAIGYFVGKAVVHYHTIPVSSSLMILPTASRHSFGVTTAYRF